MNLRTILLSGVAVVSIGTAFGSKTTTRIPGPVSIFQGGVCINWPSPTVEQFCSETYTGPQCTAIGGDLAYKFEATSTPSCSVPLRRPF